MGFSIEPIEQIDWFERYENSPCLNHQPINSDALEGAIRNPIQQEEVVGRALGGSVCSLPMLPVMVYTCESKPKGVQTQRRRVFRKQNPLTARPKRDGGRWGVAQGCDCRSILDAISTLLEAQRPDLALVLIELELNSQT